MADSFSNISPCQLPLLGNIKDAAIAAMIADRLNIGKDDMKGRFQRGATIERRCKERHYNFGDTRVIPFAETVRFGEFSVKAKQRVVDRMF